MPGRAAPRAVPGRAGRLGGPGREAEGQPLRPPGPAPSSGPQAARPRAAGQGGLHLCRGAPTCPRARRPPARREPRGCSLNTWDLTKVATSPNLSCQGPGSWFSSGVLSAAPACQRAACLTRWLPLSWHGNDKCAVLSIQFISLLLPARSITINHKEVQLAGVNLSMFLYVSVYI